MLIEPEKCRCCSMTRITDLRGTELAMNKSHCGSKDKEVDIQRSSHIVKLSNPFIIHGGESNTKLLREIYCGATKIFGQSI